jgi:hypothetical protein
MAKITREYDDQLIWDAIRQHRDFPKDLWAKPAIAEVSVRPRGQRESDGHDVTVTMRFNFSSADLPELLDSMIAENAKHNR